LIGGFNKFINCIDQHRMSQRYYKIGLVGETINKLSFLEKIQKNKSEEPSDDIFRTISFGEDPITLHLFDSAIAMEKGYILTNKDLDGIFIVCDDTKEFNYNEIVKATREYKQKENIPIVLIIDNWDGPDRPKGKLPSSYFPSFCKEYGFCAWFGVLPETPSEAIDSAFIEMASYFRKEKDKMPQPIYQIVNSNCVFLLRTHLDVNSTMLYYMVEDLTARLSVLEKHKDFVSVITKYFDLLLSGLDREDIAKKMKLNEEWSKTFDHIWLILMSNRNYVREKIIEVMEFVTKHEPNYSLIFNF
jgi:hypothetical protein